MPSNISHTPSTLSTYFKEVIYGGIDGIVTTFAVVAGFTGAAMSGSEASQLTFAVVLLFGLANLFADAASMGLGNFLSVRSEQDLYEVARARESVRLRAEPEKEQAETIALMAAKGFSITDATALATIYRKNETYWTDFMMQHKHELSDPRGDNPVLTGLATFGSFMLFGAIPLLPFLIPSEASAETAFILSSIGTFLALIALGLMKWQVVGARLSASLLEVVVVGGTAAGIAYLVGTFFAH